MQLKLSRFTVARWPHIRNVCVKHVYNIYILYMTIHTWVGDKLGDKLHESKKKTQTQGPSSSILSPSPFCSKKNEARSSSGFFTSQKKDPPPWSHVQKINSTGRVKYAESLRRVRKLTPSCIRLQLRHHSCILPRILKPNRICAKDMS